MSSVSILVLGGSGFIGKALVRELLQKRFNITLLLRPASELSCDIAGEVNRIDCADWSKEGIEALLKDRNYDFVINAASYGVNPKDRDSQELMAINLILPSILVELCHRWGAKMILLGSCSEYKSQDGDVALDEPSALESTQLYGASKAAGALMASALAESFGVYLRVLRLFNVYGLGESPHRLLPVLLKDLEAGKRVPLSSGSQVRDFIYLKDVIDAITVTIEYLRTGKSLAYTDTWNVCTGEPSSVRFFAETVAAKLNKSASQLGFGDLAWRADDMPYVVGCPKKMKKKAGWHAKYTLPDGIEDILRCR